MAASKDDLDVDTFLRLEANSFNQDHEVERILALKLKASNPVEVLDLHGKVWTEGVLETREIKVSYRKKSLLLHPDKCKHPKAQDAFEMLKKAESELMEEGKRAYMLGLIAEARAIVLKNKGVTAKPGVPTITIPSFEKDPVAAGELAVAIKIATRKLLVDQGSRDSVRMKNEVERKENEAKTVLEDKKRKAEYDKAWEATRETRVGKLEKLPQGRQEEEAQEGRCAWLRAIHHQLFAPPH
ncbi:hypothetical protein BC829DRAFT_370748 [Chytridium lagenaria]|nr:hypothetical protein BC829DRAFT_370748 [Chytridium lagenaria]